jgi:hypothetical protein
MSEHLVPVTTHTVEMEQLAQLNEALGASGAPTVTAGDLGLAALDAGGPPESAALLDLSWEGPPEYPYVHAVFRAGAGADVTVELHTQALRTLSSRLGFHHHWGV